MNQLPKYYTLKTGKASADNKLNSLDRALKSAGIGNYNLIKVSSILPKTCEYKKELPKKPPGTIQPCVISCKVSNKENETITSSIAVGESEENLKVIAEAKGFSGKQETEKKAKKRAKIMLKDRKLKVKNFRAKTIEKDVEKISTVVSAAVLGGLSN